MILLHGGLNKAIQGVQCVGGTQEILMVMTVKVVCNWNVHMEREFRFASV